MSLQLKDGDYVPDQRGGLVSLHGGEELLSRILFKLTAKRCMFPLLPDLGSRLYRLPQEKNVKRGSLAKQYVEEALADEEDITVSEVCWDERGGQVTAQLSWQGLTAPLVLDLERGEQK